MYATMTTKGQVTIPKALRDKLNLRAGDKLDFRLDDDGELRVVAATAPVTELKGMVARPARAATLAEMDEAIRAGRRGNR